LHIIMAKWILNFEEGDPEDKLLRGGKGCSLSIMTHAKMPVPPGFTITTETCRQFIKAKAWPAGLGDELDIKIAQLEKKLGKRLGDNSNPLLLSVRSGAAVSMPGMMDTVLNLGMNDEAVVGLAKLTGNERFAWDAFRRFIQMFGDVVMGVKHSKFEHILEGVRHAKGIKFDTDLSIADLKEIVASYRAMVKKELGHEFPADPKEQLRLAIDAVFDSWDTPRAIHYRDLNNIPHDLGTAVTVQSMVFGNMGDTSGTGVGFTRNPSTGVNEVYGEYLFNAQGEDVVAGIRTPHPLVTLEKAMPKIYAELMDVYQRLEAHYRDMVDLEFTIERGRLFILQARVGKRTPHAALKCAVEMVKEGLCTKKEAIMRLTGPQLKLLMHPQFDKAAQKKAVVIASGLPASPGAAVGRIVFNSADTAEWVARGEKVLLVRKETCPDDVKGMAIAAGVLTATGGMTSHAAVVARGMGRTCVAGCSDLIVDEAAKICKVKGKVYREGEWLSLDGTLGTVYPGKVPVLPATFGEDFFTFMGFCDEFRKMQVRTNAETPADTERAIYLGAEGIGLCRTEHMFFEGDRVLAVRQMILAEEEAGRRAALAKLLPYQRSDFVSIFKLLNGRPANIRLLDPPLHEFLPHTEVEQKEMARVMGAPYDVVKAKCDTLHEFNPMLGFRGVRLALVYPEISEMQVRAIFEAGCKVKKEKGIAVKAEVMIPVLGHATEMKVMRELCVRVAEEVMKEAGVRIDYHVGVMMELPRACLTAEDIAEHAEFFSFGTNDLTQTTLGYSRDDSGPFIKEYLKKKILKTDPFQVVDRDGVGQLMKMAVAKGRATRGPAMKIGICGEQGGEPNSVEFCHKIGLTYVSCSPMRVPMARLAAAQAAIRFPYGTEKQLRAKL
jgi:pyruvate,orthophosphate dikinase